MDFLETKYLYFLLLGFTISYPLAQSFEKRLKLYQSFRSIFIGVLMVMLVFIPWDIWFTAKGVWWFNESYTTGIKVFNLPIEEVLFFAFVPYACVFIYEVLNYFVKKDILGVWSKQIAFGLGVLLLIIGGIYFNQLYTFVTFILTGISLIFMAIKSPKWLGRFFLAYFVSLLPFLLINGVLTGSFIESPVVNYNPTQIIGLRLFTIPIEDAVYNLLMLLLMIAVYEKFKTTYQPKS